LSVGHDEYWTPGMRRSFEWARDEGIHLAFFSGNEIFWRVLWQNAKGKISSRIAIIGKETIEGNTATATTSTSNKEEEEDKWTGTFVDPRFRTADPQNVLTGQLFKVNGYRHDAMSVSVHDSKLRFWRDTKLSKMSKQSFPYETAAGILGYEWDVFSDDCHRPGGIMTLSTSTFRNLNGFLIENYGASYKGNGSATHKLTLYKHNSTRYADKSSLVFGSGTIQWSWALSDIHDADQPVRPDINLQQATVNLFADMGVQPASLLPHDAEISAMAFINGSLVSDPSSSSSSSPSSNSILVRAVASTDVAPPLSSIVYPRRGAVSMLKPSTTILIIRGFAVDRGGGNVANVEVSVDGGLTWRMSSHGHQHQLHGDVSDENMGGSVHHEWVYRHKVVPSPKGLESFMHLQTLCNHSGNSHYINENVLKPIGEKFRSNGNGNSSFFSHWITIMSRAVDDSGNVETFDKSPDSNHTIFYKNREFVNTARVVLKYSAGARIHNHNNLKSQI